MVNGKEIKKRRKDMCDEYVDPKIDTSSVGPSETTQQEQKTNGAIHKEQARKEQEKQEKEEKKRKEKKRKKVEDDINSGRADMC